MTDVQQLWYDYFCKSPTLGELKYEISDVYMLLLAQLHVSKSLETLNTQTLRIISQFFAELLEQIFQLRKKSPYPASYRLFIDENISKGADLLHKISLGTCVWEDIFLWLNINYMHVNHEYIYSFLTLISPYLPLPNTPKCISIINKITSGNATVSDIIENFSDN